MTTLALGLLFAVLWMALGGSFTPANFSLGLALSLAALWIVRNERSGRLRPPRPLALLRLALLFGRELFASALRVARLVLLRRMDLAPGLVRYPTTLTRDGEIALLANMITLTPGTLTVDVAGDRRTLLVHALDARDPEAVRRDIREGFEAGIRRAFR